MDIIIKNFGLQDPTVDNAPKPKTTNKEKTMDSILKDLGLDQ
ncbi:hypothetical protein [Gottfriedia acidiceleris]|nr:hypothetical protein [Gottfriedia acidiceleris]